MAELFRLGVHATFADQWEEIGSTCAVFDSLRKKYVTALFPDIVHLKSRLVGLFLFILMYLGICERDNTIY